MSSGSAHASAHDVDVVIAVRLMQLIAMYDDVQLTYDLAARRQKLRVADDLLTASRGLPIEPDLPERFAPMGSSHPGPDLARALQESAAELADRLSERAAIEALVEFVTSTDWPSELQWTKDRDTIQSDAAAHITQGIGPHDIAEVRAAERRAVKRLRADSTAPAVQAGWGLFTLVSSLAAPGIANGLGTLVGTQFLGLSGAAATSAGLALLGGGSIAAGGFGMAGGTLLVHGLTVVAKAGGKSLITTLASQSPSAVVMELSKLDVAVRLEPLRRSSVLEDLRRLQSHLGAQLDATTSPTQERFREAVKNFSEGYRGDSSESSAPVQTREVVDAQGRRNLAASCRAVEYEIRHLEASEWKRMIAKAPRAMRMPIASRLLDNF